MKNIIITFIIWIVFIISCSSQVEYYFKIYDKQTKQPIPYVQARFISFKIGFCTDVYGQGTLIIHKDSLKLIKDSLIFHALSYRTKTISLNSLKRNNVNVVYLQAKPIELNQINYSEKHRVSKVKLGNRNRKNKLNTIGNFCRIGNQQGRFIANPYHSYLKIKSVHIFITDKGKPYAPFRLRFFSVNENGLPDKDLLNKNLIVHTERKNAWLEVDVENHDIIMPESGIIVVIEYINAGDEYSHNSYSSDKAYGVVIGHNMSKKDYWISGYAGLGWTNGTEYIKNRPLLQRMKKPYYDPLIYVTVFK